MFQFAGKEPLYWEARHDVYGYLSGEIAAATKESNFRRIAISGIKKEIRVQCPLAGGTWKVALFSLDRTYCMGRWTVKV